MAVGPLSNHRNPFSNVGARPQFFSEKYSVTRIVNTHLPPFPLPFPFSSLPLRTPSAFPLSTKLVEDFNYLML